MATLQDKLDAYKADFRTKAPQDKQDIMHRATEDLRQSGILDQTIKQGQALPAFSLPNQQGETVTLESLLAKGPLVLSFFRGIWCPYCIIELEALNEAADDFRSAGASIVTIAPQLQSFATETVTKHDLHFDVLEDKGNQYAATLGTTFSLPEDLREVYISLGVDLIRYNGDNAWQLPMPLRAVIDTDGIIQHLDINPDYTVRPDPSETLAVVRDLPQRQAA